MKIKKHYNGDRLMAIIGLILSLPVAILFLVHLFSDLKLKISGIETVGVVTNVKTEYRTNDVEHYSISIKYDCGSKKGIEKDGIGTSNTYYRVDEKIALYCDENEPGKFIMKEDVTLRSMLLYLLSVLIFFLPGFVIFLVGIKRVLRQSKEKILDQNLGQIDTKVEATIVDISQSTVRYDMKLGFQITAEYGGDTFVSENIYEDIYYILDIGDKIDVYFDTEDHSKYRVDVDSFIERSNGVAEKNINVVEKNNHIPKINKEGIAISIGVGIFSLVVLVYGLVHFDSNSIREYIYWTFVTIFCFFLGIRRILLRIRSKRLKDEFVQIGTKIEATVLLALHIPHQSKNRSNRIVAKYNKETYLSEDVPIDVCDVIEKGDKIDVYFDKQDCSKYFVDTDTLYEKKMEMMGEK